MIFAAPAALYFALSTLVLMVLALLRPRLERKNVAALFLWEDLKHDARARKIHFRQLLDPLLLLQVLSVVLLVGTLAFPLLSSTRQRLSALAIVIDGSASMRTITEDGRTRYAVAVEEAKAILNENPALTTSVIQFSSSPTILAEAVRSRPLVARTLDASDPTWNGAGSIDSMVNALSAVGGLRSFDRIVFLTDGEVDDLPGEIERIGIAGGENLAITAFSIRENPSSDGATAFVEVLNDAKSDREVTVRISDGSAQTSVAVYLVSKSSEHIIVPFPNSRGTVFSVTLDVEDDFATDNERYFALDRPLDLRVRWIGPPNRYLFAALGAVTPFTLISAAEEADLTIVHQATLPSSYGGSILLVHAGIQDAVTLGDDRDRGTVTAVLPSHPLLVGLEPADIRVFSSPEANLPENAAVILQAGSEPILATWQTTTQDVTFLAPQLELTNLPLAVDLPLLIRNVASAIVRLPATLAYGWTRTGDPVPLLGRGAIENLEGPDGREMPLPSSDLYFFPDVPGVYRLTTDRGVFPLAVNIPPSESTSASPWETSASGFAGATQRRQYWVDLWPTLAGLAAVLLIAELLLRKRASLRLGRGEA